MDKSTASITDYSNFILNGNGVASSDNVYIPKQPFRMIICGPSNCGKTNLVMNLILKYLKFNKLYLYAKNVK